MAELIALLGPPTAEFRQSRQASELRLLGSEAGNWKEELGPNPDITLESLAEDIQGEDREEFLWLRAALQWNPEDRPTAKEPLFDERLIEGLEE